MNGGSTFFASDRLDAQKKELSAVKAKLVKENNIKKAKLEALEKQVDDFVEVSSCVCERERVFVAAHSASIVGCRLPSQFSPRCTRIRVSSNSSRFKIRISLRRQKDKASKKQRQRNLHCPELKLDFS